MSQENNGLLPIEVMKKIAKNLDYSSYINLTSTCKEMQQLRTDEEIFHEITATEGRGPMSEEDYILYYKRKKHLEIKQMFNYQRKLEKWKHFFILDMFLCIRRSISNIIFECIALIMMFLFFLLYALKLHDDVQLSYGIISLVLLPTVIIFGIFPYITLIIGTAQKKYIDDDDDFGALNIDNQPLHGFLNLLIQLCLWNSMMGTRIFIFFFCDVTYILFVLYSFEIFRFGFVLVPIILYCIMLFFSGCFRWNFSQCVDDVWECISIYQGIHVYTIYLSLFVFCILVLLKSFEWIDVSYTICSIPLMLMLWLYLFVHCVTLGVFTTLAMCFCNFSYGFEALDECMGIDDIDEKYSGDCAISSTISFIGSVEIPLIFITLLLYVLWLDDTYTGNEIIIFIPLLLSILFFLFIAEWLSLVPLFGDVQCCPLVCPDGCGICYNICCCTCFLSNEYDTRYYHGF
ncbi:F-box domain-containing protein [Entamoeba marina]